MQPQPAREKGSVSCYALTDLDEPCDVSADTHCGNCDRWFCAAHAGDHVCVIEEADEGGEG
jgi:hypothetical protein